MKSFESFSSNLSSNKENQERIKTSENLPAGANKKKKSVFEKLYKSKALRTLTLAGAISGAVKIMPNEGLTGRQSEVKYEKIEKKDFDLGPLKQNFSAKTEIENKEGKYIIHIGQIHGGDSLEETRKGMESIGKKTEHLIKRQKEVESLLLYLAEKYQIKDVFVEGVDDSLINLIEDIKWQIYYNDEGEKNNPQERWDAAHYFSKLAKKEIPGLTQKHRAHLLYLALCVLKNEREKLLFAQEHKNDNAQVSQEYADILKEFQDKKIDTSEVINNLSKIQKEIGEDEILKGEVIYLWGGAMKLYLENKIKVHPAETIEANQEAFSKYPAVSGFIKEELKNIDSKILENLSAEREKIFEQRNNIRENAALEEIIKSHVLERQQFIPLVYGEGHNFKDNVDKLNENNMKTGLLRLDVK